MSTTTTYFMFEDFSDPLPDPGFYTAEIESARFRQSAKDNHMLQIGYTLQAVHPAYRLVYDYFVLDGERVSPWGIVLARRRLLCLYHACGIFPKEGEEIAPTRLCGRHLQVRVEHEHRQGRVHLRVTDYRALKSAFDDSDQ